MEFQSVDWKKGIISGVIAGVVWGWLAITINTASGAFAFEETLLHRLITFTVGGVVFGIVVSGVLSLSHHFMPSRNIFMEAVFVSALLWGILEVGGVLLHLTNPERYHLVVAQAIQGFVLAVIMGGILGLFWKIGKKAN